jgi:carbon storage regulator CsrA
MLVLSRKTREQIRIGDSITISILRVKGRVVRVGIEAPREMRVVRGELPPQVAEPAETPQPVDERQPRPALRESTRGQAASRSLAQRIRHRKLLRESTLTAATLS